MAELLRRCGGALELVDGAAAAATQLAGGCVAGMRSWPVLDFRMAAHKSHDALCRAAGASEGERRLYSPSMWPPAEPGSGAAAGGGADLAHCVRLLPHRSDSGGFFVALLRKTRALPTHPSPTWRRAEPAAAAAADVEARPASLQLPAAREAHRYAPLAAEARDELCDLEFDVRAAGELAAAGHGPPPSRLRAAPLYSRSASATRVVLMGAESARVCSTARLHVVHAGATVFKRRRPGRGREGGAAHAGFSATAAGREMLHKGSPKWLPPAPHTPQSAPPTPHGTMRELRRGSSHASPSRAAARFFILCHIIASELRA